MLRNEPSAPRRQLSGGFLNEVLSLNAQESDELYISPTLNTPQ